MSETVQKLLIPEKIKVGFQERSDTYTKKLAYVIYYDHKGTLRKERSWESWRDKKIDAVEFTNEPTDGFVLNRNVGGYKSDWNYRSAHIRVYDPRDFEFEISLPNLLFILRECDCNKGKGLEGRFVYAWDGTELVLLPEGSADYQNSQKFTELQSIGVKAKELIEGATYETKSQQVWTYVGRFMYYPFMSYSYSSKKDKKPVKKYIFRHDKYFHELTDLKQIARLHSDTIDSNYANLVEEFNKKKESSPVVELFVKDQSNKDKVWYVKEGDFFVEYSIGEDWSTQEKKKYGYRYQKYSLEDGVIHKESCQESYSYGYPHYGRRHHEQFSIQPSNTLYARLENGSEIKLRD